METLLSVRATVALTAVALTAAIAGCGDDGATSTPTTAAATASSADTEPKQEACAPVDAPKPSDRTATKPSNRLPTDKRHVVTMETNCGTITILLAASRAPKTASSFASLVTQKFFNGLTFHRIVPDFVIQGGDPQGTGTGGAGYTVTEAPPSDLRYTVGTVAMAKAGSEPPGASSSQFYIVSGAQGETLPAEYALAGRVTKGLDVVRRIGALPTDPTDQPTSPVVITKATLRSSPK